MNKAHMRKQKGKTGFDENRYIGKEKGPWFTVRYSVREMASKIEVKSGAKINCSINIYTNMVDILDVHIRPGCDIDLKNYLWKRLGVNDQEAECFRKVFSSQTELWDFLEEFVNYAKTYKGP